MLGELLKQQQNFQQQMFGGQVVAPKAVAVKAEGGAAGGNAVSANEKAQMRKMLQELPKDSPVRAEMHAVAVRMGIISPPPVEHSSTAALVRARQAAQAVESAAERVATKERELEEANDQLNIAIREQEEANEEVVVTSTELARTLGATAGFGQQPHGTVVNVSAVMADPSKFTLELGEEFSLEGLDPGDDDVAKLEAFRTEWTAKLSTALKDSFGTVSAEIQGLKAQKEAQELLERVKKKRTHSPAPGRPLIALPGMGAGQPKEPKAGAATPRSGGTPAQVEAGSLPASSAAAGANQGLSVAEGLKAVALQAARGKKGGPYAAGQPEGSPPWL